MNMIDLPFENIISMDRNEFVALAESILTLHGKPTARGMEYQDDWVRIVTNFNGLDLQVTRQAQNVDKDHLHSHLSVSNPVTMVSEGQIIRHHGEHCFLVWHMKKLAEYARA